MCVFKLELERIARNVIQLISTKFIWIHFVLLLSFGGVSQSFARIHVPPAILIHFRNEFVLDKSENHLILMVH